MTVGKWNFIIKLTHEKVYPYTYKVNKFHNNNNTEKNGRLLIVIVKMSMPNSLILLDSV